MGGEEFAVFLPRVYDAEAREIAERVREKLAQTPLVINDHGQTLQCTMSIGLVTDRHSAASMETLLVRADQCLYIAKQQGRNRVVQVPISD